MMDDVARMVASVHEKRAAINTKMALAALAASKPSSPITTVLNGINSGLSPPHDTSSSTGNTITPRQPLQPSFMEEQRLAKEKQMAALSIEVAALEHSVSVAGKKVRHRAFMKLEESIERLTELCRLMQRCVQELELEVAVNRLFDSVQLLQSQLADVDVALKKRYKQHMQVTPFT